MKITYLKVLENDAHAQHSIIYCTHHGTDNIMSLLVHEIIKSVMIY